MDVSKLPKFSQTPAPPTPETPPASRPLDYAPPAPVSGGDVWFGFVIGVIFLLLGRGFGGYAMAKIAHRPHHTGIPWIAGPKAGQEVTYPELEGNVCLSESAMFLFGAAIIADTCIHLVLTRRPRAGRLPATLGFGLTAFATLYNLYAAGVLLNAGVMPLLSILAVALGGYAAYQDWRLIQMPRTGGMASR